MHQIPLMFAGEGSVSRADLIEGAANQTAIAMIDAWPDWPGYLTILVGPTGSGKTHIASAWLAETGGCIVASQVLSEQLDAVQSVVQQGGCVVVEDVQAGALDEVALFHLLNTVRQQGSFCMITAQKQPGEWQVGLADLGSRLRGAQVVEISAPDEALLKQVMIKLFADRQLIVDEKVLDYCLPRMERSLEFAVSLVDALDREALARKKPITRAIAGEVLATMTE